MDREGIEPSGKRLRKSVPGHQPLPARKVAANAIRVDRHQGAEAKSLGRARQLGKLTVWLLYWANQAVSA